MLDFSRPQWLALLAVVPLLWLIGRRSLVSLSPGRRRAALVLRAAIVLLLTMALAGARWTRLSDRLCVLFVLDASDSVRADADVDVIEGVCQSFDREIMRVRFPLPALSKNPVFIGVS